MVLEDTLIFTYARNMRLLLPACTVEDRIMNLTSYSISMSMYVHNLRVLLSSSGTVEFILCTRKGISMSDSQLYVMILEEALSQKHK